MIPFRPLPDRPSLSGQDPAAGPLRAGRVRFFLCGGALLALAACGGTEDGGSGGGYSVTPPVTADSGGSGILGSYYVSTFAPYEALAAQLRNSALYAIQNVSWNFTANPGTVYDSFAPASARVEYAHAAGLTGEGQVVAIVDAGFLATHEAIADSIAGTEGTIPVDDHGTAVASVVAGHSDTMVGVAPNASLLLGYFNGTNRLASATDMARTRGAVAQNNSWGYVDTSGNTIYVSPANYAAYFGTGNAYTQALQNYAAEGVVVFAMSNDTGDTSAGLMEALPVITPALESGWLAVGNAVPDFDNDGINSVQLLSAACHEAAAWCLLADGSWEAATATSNTSYGFEVGSSFAAPQVSGALALLAEAFPNLTPHDLRLRLLASADNGFFTPTSFLEIENGLSHGYNDTYGHGFLDLRAALLPIGTPRVTLSNGNVALLNQPLVVAGSAFGDSVTRSLSKVDISVTDALNADFRTPGGTLAATAGLPELGTSRLARAFANGLAERRLASTSALADTFDAFPGRVIDARSRDGGLSASVLVPQGGAGDYGIAVSTALTDGPTRLDLGLKVARDQGTVLGLGGDGAGNNLLALQLGLSQELAGDGFLSLTGEVGVADLAGTDLLSNVSTARFNSLGFEIGQHNVMARGDRLAFGARMPMAVTSGGAEAVLPVTRAAGTSYEPVSIDLSPAARQVDLSVSYQRPLGDNVELMLELVHAENLGNRAGARDSAAVIALSWSF